mmetsp:Transcript_63403/g.168020  ORF Transcript_63403/g.168020 Transcript_63403/m.168020 type:complete len:419 (+) Transcript_63403:1141-2397(+)
MRDILKIDVGDLQRLRELRQHHVDVLVLFFSEETVHLHGNETPETLTDLRYVVRIARSANLNLFVALQGLVIEGHPRNCAVERLVPHRGPRNQGILGLCIRRVAVHLPRGQLWKRFLAGLVREEVLELLAISVLHPIHELDLRALGHQATITLPGHVDALSVVRNEHCESRHVRETERPRQLEGHRAGQRTESPLYLRIFGPVVVITNSDRATTHALDAANVHEDPWLDGLCIGKLCDVHVLQILPVDLGVAFQIGHRFEHLIVDLVLVTHELHDLIPHIREGPVHLMGIFVTVTQHHAREPFWDGREAVLETQYVQRARHALPHRHKEAQHGTAQHAPELSVGEVQQTAGAPEAHPLQHILVPDRTESVTRQITDRCLTGQRHVQVFDISIHRCNDSLGHGGLDGENHDPKGPPHQE